MEAYQPGAVIRARGALWRVREVGEGGFLRAELLDGSRTALFHPALEGDALTLMRSPEPPARPAADPALFRLYVEAEHLKTLNADAPILALQRSRVVPHNYQLVPLLMALENPARVRLLIADDVGLGKTIEAGLILKELLLRGAARRVLVLTPAHLKADWQEALRRFFHLAFQVVDRSALRRLPGGKSPWQVFDRVIASIDYAKQGDQRPLVLAQPWDVVVVDEAHLAARHRGRHERFRLVRELAERAPHLLLVTATPHSGHPESFLSLVEHLDPDGALGLVAGSTLVRERARRHVVQRTRQDVLDWYAREQKAAPFPERDARPVPVIPGRREALLFAAVADYARMLESSTRAPAHWLAMHFARRAASSPRALYESLQNRIARLEELRATGGEEGEEDPFTLAGLVVDTPGERGEEEEGDRALDVALVQRARAEAELAYLRKLEEALKARARRPDTKFQRLVALLQGELAGKKTLVFTRYRDTLEYLAQLLPRHLEGVPVFALHGGHTENEREDVLARFARAGEAVLVATDVISEGLNLQYHASQVVHYELPWNPNRLEQRNGRVDRFGQPEPVVKIRLLFYENSLDALIFRRLIAKALRIKETFGVVPNYFGDEEYVRRVVEDALRAEGYLPQSPQAGLFESFVDTGDEEAARRARAEGFYGQSVFQLPDVERALRRSFSGLLEPLRLADFFRRALGQLGWGLVAEPGGVLRVAQKGRPLPDFDPPVGHRLSFDPWNTDPGVERLDLAHPAVAAALEAVFRRAWDPHAGARSAILAGPVAEPTYLYLFRARFTRPGELAESLFVEGRTPSGRALGPEEAERLLFRALEGFSDPGLPAEAARSWLEDAHARAPSGEEGARTVLARLREERARLAERLRAVYGRELEPLRDLAALEPAGPPEWLGLAVVVGGAR